MIDNACKMGVPRVIDSASITTSNVKTNTLFCSYIFNTKHGLKPLDDEVVEEEDDEGTVEER